MRPRPYRQLQHLVRRLLLWLHRHRPDLYEVLRTWCLIGLVHELRQPGHGYAFAWLLFYIYCRRRSP